MNVITNSIRCIGHPIIKFAYPFRYVFNTILKYTLNNNININIDVLTDYLITNSINIAKFPIVCDPGVLSIVCEQLYDSYCNYVSGSSVHFERVLVVQPDLNEFILMHKNGIDIYELLYRIHNMYCVFDFKHTFNTLLEIMRERDDCVHIIDNEMSINPINNTHILPVSFNEETFLSFKFDNCEFPNYLVDVTPIYLLTINHHHLDNRIKFEESTHTYRIDFKGDDIFTTVGVTSTTTVIHNYFSKFNADEAIFKMRNGRNWNVNNKYWGRTNDEIKLLWEENRLRASSKGTFLHYTLERDCNGISHLFTNYGDIIEMCQYRRWKSKYMDDMNLVPYRTEFRMFTDEFSKVCGTADLLAVSVNHPSPLNSDETLYLHLIDWKFSKEIKYNNKYQKGLNILKDMDDCNFNHYVLQQNLYKYILETHYFNWSFRGEIYKYINIVDMRLAVFHQNYGEDGLNIIIPDKRSIIIDIINDRVRTINTETECSD